MSSVTSSYQVNSELAGVLGVIGPTRMDYKDVIPVVDVTAGVERGDAQQLLNLPTAEICGTPCFLSLHPY